jgi:signal transduction histidine kinase
LEKLIGNGLKFNRPGTPPVVKVKGEVLAAPGSNGDRHKSASLYHLTVEDNGIGFDKKYLDRIFNVFQRLHGRNQYEGTGIGLAICRKIAQRHCGDITATSAPGKGSTFIVTLPSTQKNKDRL